jgi:HlyD family secretion protein
LLVDINVTEIDVNLVQPGQDVMLTFDGILAKEYHGTVIEVAPVGNETQGVTSFEVTVMLLDADEDVHPEMTSAVDIVTSEVDDVLLIPNRAIRMLDGERVVYVLKDPAKNLSAAPNRFSDGLLPFNFEQSALEGIVPVPIILGDSSALYSEVISGDLEQGDLVVLNPPTEILLSSQTDGIAVEMQP